MPKLERTIAVVQMDCTIGDVAANLNKIAKFAEAARSLEAELVIFPECATTGYFVGDALSTLADAPEGSATLRLGEVARTNDIHLACGLYTQEKGVFRNSQQLFSPKGELLATYHKAHLFAVERTLYAAGDQPTVVETAIGRIGMTIWYDLIFPEYIRKLIELRADLIINSTDWINDPYQRDVWGWTEERIQGLASTRALENVVPLAMACRTGRENASPDVAFDSMGPSCVVSHQASSSPGSIGAKVSRSARSRYPRRIWTAGPASRRIGPIGVLSFTAEFAACTLCVPSLSRLTAFPVDFSSPLRPAGIRSPTIGASCSAPVPAMALPIATTTWLPPASPSSSRTMAGSA